ARFSTTQAKTSSSRSSSFTAITATCCTSGWVSSTASTSAAAMFSPERRMMFFLRSTKCSMPSGPTHTTSPVGNPPTTTAPPERAPAGRCSRVAHQELAGLAIADVAIGIVDDAHLDARSDAAEGAGADLARFDAVGQHARHLGHAPDLDHGKAEALFEGGMQFGLDAGADAEAHGMAPLVLIGREL